VVDSLKALDPEWPIREADIARRDWRGKEVPQAAHCAQLATTLLPDGFPHHRRMYEELPSFIQHRGHFGCNLAVTNSFTAFSASACAWAL
jgi:hypothetical protein